jgi:hypothetical protein
MRRHLLLGVAGAVLLAGLCTGGTAAAEPGMRTAARAATASDTATGARIEEFSAQSRETRHRRPRRVRIYAPRGPGPNSVRICHSYYEYEHRVSGTVIVPRQNCYWSG